MTDTLPVTEDRIEQLVRAFYAKARADDLIGPVFDGAVKDWEEHFQLLTAFWSSVMLGSGRYQGRPMQVHMRLPLEPEMFGRWLDLWHETAGEVFEEPIAELFRAKARNIARSLSLGAFFRPEAVAPGA
jgi:hemoglobin